MGVSYLLKKQLELEVGPEAAQRLHMHILKLRDNFKAALKTLISAAQEQDGQLELFVITDEVRDVKQYVFVKVCIMSVSVCVCVCVCVCVHESQFPCWVTVHVERMSRVQRTQSYERLSLHNAGSRSDYNFACFAYCLDFRISIAILLSNVSG